MNITRKFILSVSTNSAAAKNGADLAAKKSFNNTTIDKDKTFIAGECLGSGKNPYFCSVDFIDERAPVFRCTCPSRQIPCKHVLGLMWAYAEGQKFTVAEIPADIIAKRENKEKRAAKAKEKSEKPAGSEGEPRKKSAASKKANMKKIDAQLAGVAEAEKILTGACGTGLGSIDAKGVENYNALTKQLDSYFIPGIQNELFDLFGMMKAAKGAGKGGQDDFDDITEKLCKIYSLLVRAKTYLEKKKETEGLVDVESEIEELIGYAWKLDELAGYGLAETDAKLVQLCFHVRREDDKKQYVEEGFYISLGSGKIYKTRNYRPFKALKHIKEEDSVFGVLTIPKLHVYPSMSLNPRVRWEDNTMITYGDLSAEDYRLIRSFAGADFTEAVKAVKNQLKNLYLFPHPVALVLYEKVAKLSGEKYVIYDKAGAAICLKKSGYCQEGFIYLIDRLTEAEAAGGAMLLLFDNNAATGELFAQPLAVVTDDKIIRLLY